MIGGITNMAMGTVGNIFSSIAGIKWDKKMSKLLEEDPAYTADPNAKQRLGMAQTLLNARMPGAAAAERNIYGAGANATAAAARGATDASQFLALASGIQGQEGQQFMDLQSKEAQDYGGRLDRLTDASKGMSEEHKALFDDSVRRWQDKININTAQYTARANGGKSIGALGSSFGDTSGFGGGGSGGGGFSPASSGMGSMGSLSGGGNTLGGGISDKRLKRNYHIIGKSKSGINIYQFQYLWSDDIYVGAMAQENPQASFDMGNGFLAIDYNKIDVQFKQL